LNVRDKAILAYIIGGYRQDKLIALCLTDKEECGDV